MAHFEKVRTSVGVRSYLPARLCAASYGGSSGQSRASMGAWPVAFHAGPFQTLPRLREVWGWLAFGRVN